MHLRYTRGATRMMPVPTHLAGLLVPKESAIDEGSLNATVVCKCGGNRFDLLYPGETQEYGGEMIPCTVEVNGHFFFVLKARCTSCSIEHLLFDKDFHGWNGFVCHDESQASLARPALARWRCLKCSKPEHEASVQIQTQGKQDFVEEGGGELGEERWPDGFGWFTMAITCTSCGKHTPEWVSYETM
jgi:hypothetical protein